MFLREATIAAVPLLLGALPRAPVGRFPRLRCDGGKAPSIACRWRAAVPNFAAAPPAISFLPERTRRPSRIAEKNRRGSGSLNLRFGAPSGCATSSGRIRSRWHAKPGKTVKHPSFKGFAPWGHHGAPADQAARLEISSATAQNLRTASHNSFMVNGFSRMNRPRRRAVS